MKPNQSHKWRDRFLISAVVVLQAGLLFAGWTLTFKHTQHQVDEGIDQLVLAANADYAEGISAAVGDLSGKFVVGDEQWDRVQTAIESLVFPGEGFACVLNEDGYVMAHPDFRSRPGMAQMTHADTPFLKKHDGEELALYKIDAVEPVAGTIDMGEHGIHYVVTQQINDAGYRLMVHQPLDGLATTRASVTQGVVWSSILIGILVLIPTAVLSWYAIRRHHRDLRRWNAELEAEVQRRIDQFSRSRDALVLGLAKLADFRDNETGQHLERICRYSVLLAEELQDATHPQIDAAWIERLNLAASMHDIGKVGVPDNVLLKPGKLTDEEYDVIKQHPTMGADTLIAIREQFDNDPLIDMSIEVTLSHHERWDGNGYPHGKTGDSIPLSARIVSVADVYDALTVKRVYKPAMPHEKALTIIAKGRGTQFDPEVVDAFLRIQHKVRAIADSLRDPEEHHDSTAA